MVSMEFHDETRKNKYPNFGITTYESFMSVFVERQKIDFKISYLNPILEFKKLLSDKFNTFEEDDLLFIFRFLGTLFIHPDLSFVDISNTGSAICLNFVYRDDKNICLVGVYISLLNFILNNEAKKKFKQA